MAGAALAVVPLMCWRVAWVPEASEAAPDAVAQAVVVGPGSVLLAHGLQPIDRAVGVTAVGAWDKVYFGETRLVVGGHVIGFNNSSVKAIPIPGGFVAIPLRPLPFAPTTLVMDPAVHVDATAAPILLRQRILFGLPCLVPRWLAACAVERLVAGVPLEVGPVLAFGGPEAGYLLEGWSSAEPGRRWTDGRRAELLFRPAGLPAGQGVAVTVVGHAYLPEGGRMRVRVRAGPSVVADWVFVDNEDHVVRAEVPRGTFDATGSVLLSFDIDAPHRSPERRMLGLSVQSMQLSGTAPGLPGPAP